MRLSAVFVALSIVAYAGEKAPSTGAPTCAKEVSRIIQKNCEGCHRPGQIGPFPLTSYEEVRPFSTEIKRATADNLIGNMDVAAFGVAGLWSIHAIPSGDGVRCSVRHERRK